MSDNHYDVIIIGSGAGGGTLAYKLAPSGKRILLLERGPYVPREKENWDSHAVDVEARYHIKEPWFDKDGKEFHAGAHYYVGGNTKFYGAALIRLRQQDFGEVRHTGRHLAGLADQLRRPRAVLHAGRASLSSARRSAASIPPNRRRARRTASAR